MNKIKPFERISTRFHVSNESAKYFLGRVQKSFKTEKPSHKMIVEFIETQDMEFLLTPYEVAAMMNESGIWAFELITAPPILMDDEELDI